MIKENRKAMHTVSSQIIMVNSALINEAGFLKLKIAKPDISAEWNPQDKGVALPNVGLYLSITGVNLYDRYIEINPDLGFNPLHLAYRLAGGEWIFVPQDAGWTISKVFFTIPPFDGRNEDGLEIVFPAGEGQTLPVELSSFTATVTTGLFVELQWIAETETNMLGYNVFRSTDIALIDAVRINNTIIQANNISHAVTYNYTDEEVTPEMTYYYWLQANDLDLTHQFYGPVSVLVEDQGEDGTTPQVELVTALKGAYPNPFNPSTSISFSLAETANISLTIYNAKGQVTGYLINEQQFDKGNHSVLWNGKDLTGRTAASGVFFYRMETDQGFSETKKMLLLK